MEYAVFFLKFPSVPCVVDNGDSSKSPSYIMIREELRNSTFLNRPDSGVSVF